MERYSPVVTMNSSTFPRPQPGGLTSTREIFRTFIIFFWDVTHLPQSGLEGLAYRPDVGLVSAWTNRPLYERLKREAGPLLEEGKKVKNTNVLGILVYLNFDPLYYSHDCNIPLVSFSHSYP